MGHIPCLDGNDGTVVVVLRFTLEDIIDFAVSVVDVVANAAVLFQHNVGKGSAGVEKVTVRLNESLSLKITGAADHAVNDFFFGSDDFAHKYSAPLQSLFLEKAENINIDDIVADSTKLTDVDYMSDYAAHLREMIKKGVNAENYEKPLDGFKIIVDAGNGVGGFYAEHVLKPLGADTEGSQFLEPDGMFPNHIPNPENADAMKSICSAVINSKADFGIIFDTDVDRAGCVDRDGEEINRNRLVALASYIALEGHENGVIVTDSVTSDGLKTYIESIGGEHYRYKRGYRNVINKQIELNNSGKFCPLAIETSGHAAFKENYYLDDGAYLMTKIVILLARDKTGNAIQDILAPLQQPVEAKELRFAIGCEDFKAYGEDVIAKLEKYYSGRDGWKIADDNREGMRISADKANGDGWLLLRLSVHDPIMPLNIESNTAGGVMQIAKDFYEFIRAFDELDVTPIEKFIG